MKACGWCWVLKPFSEFWIQRGSQLRYRCKDCMKQARLPNNERDKKSMRENYYKNKERYKSEARKWQLAHPEKRRETNHKYYKSHPEVRMRTWVMRRQRVRQAPGVHTAEQLVALLKAQCFSCAICKADLTKTKKHADHIVPLCSGGSHDIENIQILCASCNVKKGKKNNQEFIESFKIAKLSAVA